MNYAKIEPMSIVDGDGCRVSIFMSGCDIHCNGCFNSVAWDFNYGKKFTEIELNELITLCNKPYISGISILGGEPCSLNNQAEVLKIIKKLSKPVQVKMFGYLQVMFMKTIYILIRKEKSTIFSS